MIVLFVTALVVALGARVALADEGDSAKVAAHKLFVGQQVQLVLEVATPAGATVEVDPAAESWNEVEVIRLGKTTVTPRGSGELHHIEVVIAPFRPGAGAFAAAVNVVTGATVSPRTLPEVQWEVTPTLPAGAELAISPLLPPAAINGAESALLRPAIGLGAFVSVLLLAAAAWFTAGAVRRWLAARPRPLVESPAVGAPAFDALGDLIQVDPVSAYRALGSTVKLELGRRYGFVASALTTIELRERMEGRGVDRWQARLVGGLLEECDAVVYAGYRPAAERREADLNMAREIVEGVS